MPSSSRSRTTGGPQTFSTSHIHTRYANSWPSNPFCGTTPFLQQTSVTTVIPNYYSKIDDSVGTFDYVPGGYPQRNVIHEQWKSSFTAPLWGEAVGSCNCRTTREGPSYFQQDVLVYARSFVPPIGEFFVFNDNAYYKLVAQFPTEVSVANFFWELREIMQLLPALKQSFSQTIANGYLTLEFGWIPFISDIQKLLSVMQTVQARLAYLRSRWGKVTSLGEYGRSVTTDSVVKTKTFNLSPSTYNMKLRCDVKIGETIYRAGGRLFHTLEWIDDANAEWGALVGALGFRDPLSIVWEAIPYSFVVDWFADIESWIARHGHIEAPEDWNVSRLSSSRKTTVQMEIFQVNPLGFQSTSTKPDLSLGTFVYKKYERYRGLPTSIGFDRLSLTSPKQLALLAALAVGHS